MSGVTRVLVALVLVVIGLAWLLDQMGVAGFGLTWDRGWPLVLVAGGLYLVARRQMVPGGIMLLFGAIFSADAAGLLPGPGARVLAPAAIIVAGIVILLAVHRRPRPHDGTTTPRKEAVATDARDTLDVSVAFSSRVVRNASTALRGGRLEATFGSIEADLGDATPAPGGARLQAGATFGSVEVRVPASWRVDLRGSPVLGAIRDETRPPGGDAPTLVVEAAAAFGSVTVRN